MGSWSLKVACHFEFYFAFTQSSLWYMYLVFEMLPGLVIKLHWNQYWILISTGSFRLETFFLLTFQHIKQLMIFLPRHWPVRNLLYMSLIFPFHFTFFRLKNKQLDEMVSHIKKLHTFASFFFEKKKTNAPSCLSQKGGQNMV